MISLIVPKAANADIYQWTDENGTTHFTNVPANIPKQHRSSKKPVLRSPSNNNRPGLSIIGSSSSDESPSAFTGSYPSAYPTPSRYESPQVQSEQLQARITAKEQFIESIDRKRSNILNPLGNRFVSPEDLELYNKYSEELPKDRQRLGELQSILP
jgi:hypothetical protein